MFWPIVTARFWCLEIDASISNDQSGTLRSEDILLITMYVHFRFLHSLHISWRQDQPSTSSGKISFFHRFLTVGEMPRDWKQYCTSCSDCLRSWPDMYIHGGSIDEHNCHHEHEVRITVVSPSTRIHMCIYISILLPSSAIQRASTLRFVHIIVNSGRGVGYDIW